MVLSSRGQWSRGQWSRGQWSVVSWSLFRQAAAPGRLQEILQDQSSSLMQRQAACLSFLGHQMSRSGGRSPCGRNFALVPLLPTQDFQDQRQKPFAALAPALEHSDARTDPRALDGWKLAYQAGDAFETGLAVLDVRHNLVAKKTSDQV